jgi:IPT/TIG domain
MRLLSTLTRLFAFIGLLLISITTQAGSPLWTFTPLTATTVSISPTSTATIMYTVTNQSRKAHTLTMKPIQGITQMTTGPGVCGSTFTLAGSGASCILSLQINGSEMTNNIVDGPIVCQQNSASQCYRPGQVNILRISIDTMVSAPTLSGITATSGAASGNVGVTLTGTNFTGTTGVTFGGAAATSVNVVNSTTVTAVTPAHAVGAVDVVLTTPGGSATLSGGYTYLVTAIGQPSGGGTIACLGGGTQDLIAATANNSSGIDWGGAGTAIGPSAQSFLDGATNTSAIVTTLGAGTNYAAGLCAAYEVDSQGNTPCQAGNTCYSDWYLPATAQLDCLYTNRVAIGGFDNNGYWSSTEDSGDPANGAWFQEFFGGTGASVAKSIATVRVRCVRSFTP